MSSTPSTGRLLRLTLPHIRGILLQRKRFLVFLALVSLLLGTVPAIKSQMESQLLQQVGDILRGAGPDPGERVTLDEILSLQLEDPPRRSQSDGGLDLLERLTTTLLGGVRLSSALWIYLIAGLLTFGLELASTLITTRVGQDVFAALRGEGMRRGLLTDPSELPSLTNTPGQYAVAIQQGASNVARTYSYLLDAGNHLFAIATTIVLVATKMPVFALVYAVLVVLQALVSVSQGRRLAERRKQYDQLRNGLVAESDEILSKRDILVAFEQQDRYGVKLNEGTKRYAELERELTVGEQRFRGLSTLVTDYGRLIILAAAVALAMVFGRSQIASVGDVYFLVSVYVRLFVPVSNVLRQYDSLRRSEATSNVFLELLEQPPAAAPARPGPATSLQWTEGEPISFENVSFTYDRKHHVLTNCTFDIPAGKTTLLLGPSGSGKTTITRLLLRFWPVTQGEVRLGGGRIQDYSAEALRKRMSYVSQHDHIVDDTVWENLSWGDRERMLSPEEARQALSHIGLRPADATRDLLEERAKSLSIGQQQRLSVARLLLDPSEILILDEPLAGLDVFTLRDILPKLTEVLKRPGRTTLIVSHRLAFVALADHIVVLGSSGRVVEQGSPSDLLTRHGVFKDVYAAAHAELDLKRDNPMRG